MPRTIKPADVAAQINHDIGEATEFCSELLEDVNDHNVSMALSAVNAGDIDLACDFLKLEEEQEVAGELTKELKDKRDELIERLHEAQKE